MKTFETFFECSDQNLSNLLCQFWNGKSIPPQILYSCWVSWKTIPLYFLAQTVNTFLKRSPLKWKFWKLKKAQPKICQISYVNFETTSLFLSKFCIPLQFHERLFHCSFLAQAIYTLLERSPLKWKFLRLSSTRVKFCQIPYANFEATSRFHYKFCIFLHFHERLFLCIFLA